MVAGVKEGFRGRKAVGVALHSNRRGPSGDGNVPCLSSVGVRT